MYEPRLEKQVGARWDRRVGKGLTAERLLCAEVQACVVGRCVWRTVDGLEYMRGCRERDEPEEVGRSQLTKSPVPSSQI